MRKNNLAFSTVRIPVGRLDWLNLALRLSEVFVKGIFCLLLYEHLGLTIARRFLSRRVDRLQEGKPVEVGVPGVDPPNCVLPHQDGGFGIRMRGHRIRGV